MSSTQVRKLGAADYKDAFRDFDKEIERDKERNLFHGDFDALAGWIPSDDDGALGFFLFQNDALKEISFDYYLLPHAAPPGLSEGDCNKWFTRIQNKIKAAYGKPTKIDNTFDRSGRTTVLTWLSEDHAIWATKFIDELGTDGPRCGNLHVKVFFGTEAESQKFESELTKFAASQPKDTRSKPSVSNNHE